MFISIILVFALFGCTASKPSESSAPSVSQAASDNSKYPEECGYFELLGIESKEVKEIRLVYEPKGLPESFPPRLARTLIRNDSETGYDFQKAMSDFDVQLKRVDAVQWSQSQPPYIENGIQAVFIVRGKEYCAPVLDLYTPVSGGLGMDSWIVYEGQCVYQITDLPGRLSNPIDKRGLGIRLFRYAEIPTIYEYPFTNGLLEKSIESADRPIVSSPYRWKPDEEDREVRNLSELIEKSELIFKGEIRSTQSANYTEMAVKGLAEQEQFEVEIQEVYRGSLQEGETILLNHLFGYDSNSQIYMTRINDSERALQTGKEYVFCLFHPTSSQLRPTNYLFGITEVIDDRLWPVFNAEPSAAWIYDLSLDDFQEEVKAAP